MLRWCERLPLGLLQGIYVTSMNTPACVIGSLVTTSCRSRSGLWRLVESHIMHIVKWYLLKQQNSQYQKCGMNAGLLGRIFGGFFSCSPNVNCDDFVIQQIQNHYFFVRPTSTQRWPIRPVPIHRWILHENAKGLGGFVRSSLSKLVGQSSTNGRGWNVLCYPRFHPANVGWNLELT